MTNPGNLPKAISNIAFRREEPTLEELRRRQEAQHDHDALHRFENEGGTCVSETAEMDTQITIDVGKGDTTSIRLYAEAHGIAAPNLAATILSEAEAAAIVQHQAEQAEAHRQAEIARLQSELSATPLAKAYRKWRTATTGKQQRNARAHLRRAQRQQMAKAMKANSPELARRPDLCKTIAAQIVRNQSRNA